MATCQKLGEIRNYLNSSLSFGYYIERVPCSSGIYCVKLIDLCDALKTFAGCFDCVFRGTLKECRRYCIDKFERR